MQTGFIGFSFSVQTGFRGFSFSVQTGFRGFSFSVQTGFRGFSHGVQTGFKVFSFSVQTGFRGTQPAQKAVVIFPSHSARRRQWLQCSSRGMLRLAIWARQPTLGPLRLPSAHQPFSSTCLLPSAVTNNYLHNLLPHSSSIASFKSPSTPDPSFLLSTCSVCVCTDFCRVLYVASCLRSC